MMKKNNRNLALLTERLYLAPRTIADLEECMAMDRDPLVTKHIPGPWDKPKQHRDFILNKMNQPHPYPLGYWSIFEGNTADVFLGWVMAVPTDEAFGPIEIGWRLNQKAWGHGYATEATQKVLHIIKEQCADVEVVAYIAPENIGSISVAKKIGMAHKCDVMLDGNKELLYSTRARQSHG